MCFFLPLGIVKTDIYNYKDRSKKIVRSIQMYIVRGVYVAAYGYEKE